MRRLIDLYLNRQFLKFLIAGGLAALANFASRFAFEAFMGYAASICAAFVVGLMTAFTLNRIFVFPASTKPLRAEMSWFFLFNLLTLPFVIGVAIALTEAFALAMPIGYAKSIAHAIAIVLPVFVNFVAHKFITFAKAR